MTGWISNVNARLKFEIIENCTSSYEVRELTDMMSTSEGEGVMEKRILLGRLCEFFSINQIQM